MLDIDHGTYPYVTSSNATVGGVLHRARRADRSAIDAVLGVAKAYTTRVGDGPMPTELKDAIGERLRERGQRVRRRRPAGRAAAAGSTPSSSATPRASTASTRWR